MGNFTHPSVFDAHVGETTVEFLRGEMTVESNNLSVMSMRLRCTRNGERLGNVVTKIFIYLSVKSSIKHI